MLLQAIPVLHFFSSHKAVFFALMDEEKPEVKSKATKDGKECLAIIITTLDEQAAEKHVVRHSPNSYPSPLLEFLTPPPDFS
jgi:hypothetical protein